jgi:hypothetical protein
VKLTFMPEAGLPPKKKPQHQRNWRLKQGLSVLVNGRAQQAAVKEMKIEKKLEPVGSARGSLV